jgi:hypothetical protein
MRVFSPRFVVAALVCATALCGCASQEVSFSPSPNQSYFICERPYCPVEPSFAPYEDGATDPAVLTYEVTFHNGSRLSRLLGDRKCESALIVELYAEAPADEAVNAENFSVSCSISSENAAILTGRVQRVRLVKNLDGRRGIEVSLRATFVDRVRTRKADLEWSFELTGVPKGAPVADTSGCKHPPYYRLNTRGEISLTAYVTLVYWADGRYDWHCWNDRLGRKSALMSPMWSERAAWMEPVREIWNGYRVVYSADEDEREKPEEPGIR